MRILILSMVHGPSHEINQIGHISKGEFIVGRGDENDRAPVVQRHLSSTEQRVFQQHDDGRAVSDIGHDGLMLVQRTATVPIDRSGDPLAASDWRRIGNDDPPIDLQEDERSFEAISFRRLAEWRYARLRVIARWHDRRPVMQLDHMQELTVKRACAETWNETCINSNIRRA